MMKNKFGVLEALLEVMGPWEARLRRLGTRSASRNVPANVYCFGQSHAMCLRRGWKRGLYRPNGSGLEFRFLLADNKQFPIDRIVKLSPITGQYEIYPELMAAFERHGVFSGDEEAWLVSVLRGNDCNLFGLFEPVPPFDFMHPDMPKAPLQPGAAVVPYGAIRAKFVAEGQTLHRFFAALPRKNVAGVLHVEAPPPIPDMAQCERSLERRLLTKALNIPQGTRISAPEFRMKLWRCQSEVTREICAAHDVIYVSPPEPALDADGYLVRKAWFGATHASAWYGGLLLKKIDAVITQARTALRASPESHGKRPH